MGKESKKVFLSAAPGRGSLRILGANEGQQLFWRIAK
jgi:hypothetical protein